MKTKSSIMLVVMIGLIISSCGQKQVAEATLTPVINASPTVTEPPTLTPTENSSPIATETLVATGHTPLPEAVKLAKEALSYSTQGDDQKAIETYAKAMEADPLYGQPYINRGAIYADHRELEKALADFNKGLKLDPANEFGYSNRAQVYIELGKLDEALEDIKSLLNLTKDDEYVKRALTIGGHIYEAQDKPYFAIAAYTAALEIDSSFIPALIGRGQIYLNQGDRLRAFADLTIALNTAQDDEIHEGIRNIFMKAYPEGTSLDEAIKASEPHYYKAMDYDKAGDYKNAIESLSKAIEIDPLNPEYYYQRGLDFANDGNLLEAITDVSYMIALKPDDPRGYFSRGLMEANLGLASESVADMEKALEFDLDSGTKARANQALKDMSELQKSCKFTTFKTMSDAEKPTFEFTFVGPPNTDFIVAALSKVTGAGSVMKDVKTLPNGVTPTAISYDLSKDETAPIELDVRVRAGNCSLLKTVIWPEIDILAELSGTNP